MAGGKHSADKFDLFNKKKGDKDDYTSNVDDDAEVEDEDFVEKPKGDREENFEEYYEQPLQVRLENAREDDEDEEYEDDEYYDERRINPIMILAIVAVIIVIIIIISFIVMAGKNKKEEPAETEPVETATEVTVKSLEENYEGFKVLGKIRIDKINIEQYILDSTTDAALEKGVGKLYGGALNIAGNYTIVGHNKKDIFEDLPELSVGDEIIIIDKKLGETPYKVTEKKTVEPNDLEMLQSTSGKTEITLITCESGSTKRLVVKAEKSGSTQAASSKTTNTTVGN